MKTLKTLVAILLIVLSYKPQLFAQTKIFSSTRAQIEPYIAVNPTNPNNLIGVVLTEVGVQQFKIGYYYSTNGGQSWAGNENTYGTTSEGDPVVVFDDDGTAYVFYQVFSANSFYMRKSTDGGVTWQPALSSQATLVFTEDPGSVIDKPWAAISPIRNSQSSLYDIYLSYTSTNITTNIQTVILLKSTTGGSAFVSIYAKAPGTNLANNGTSVATGPNGEIYFSWVTMAQVSHVYVVQSISAVRSPDGINFDNPVTIGATQIGDNVSGTYMVKGAIRVDSYPRLAVDKSGQFIGNVYLTWADKGTSTNADIKMIKGVYSGGSFSWQTTPTTVDASAGEQWMPAISVSPDGVISILYYSSGINRLDPIYTYVKYSTDGGSTFSSAQNVGSPSGFTIPSTGNVFLGDYQGSSSWFGKAHSIFCEYITDPTYNARQIYYNYTNLPSLSPPTNYQKVVVDQRDESNQSFESFARWNQGQFTNYVAPSTFIVPLNNGQVIRGKQDFKQGTYQKYNNWSQNSDNKNFKNFLIDAFTQNITSNFKSSQTGVTIKNQLLESTSVGDGTISFADPWLIDFYESPYGMRNEGTSAPPKSKQSPFYPDYSTYYGSDIYKGVFLNQNPTFDPNLPIYSAQALNFQSINGHSAYFQNWSASSATLQSATSLTTPVVFTLASATVTANYKGNLISNSNTGFNSNNQRKVVRTDDGKLHMVYESLNQVWYTYSTDGGTTWQPEQKVDAVSTNTKSCSISQNSNIVFIVYQSDFGTGTIRAARFENGVRSWFTDVYSLSSYGYDTQPVIAAYGSDGGLVVFKPTSTSPLRARNVKCTSISCAAGTVGTDFQLTTSTVSSTSPSLVYNNQEMFLAFQNGSSQIKYVAFTAGADYENNLDTSTVSTGSPFTNNQSPSISVQAYNPVISWNGFNTPIPSAVVIRKTGSTWSTFKTLGSGTVRYTNNNSRRDGGEGSIIAWCDIYNAHKFVKLDTGNYSSILTLPEGSGNGQIQVSNGIGFSDMKAVAYQQPTSGIYPVKFVNYNFQTLQKVNGTGNMNYGRMAIIQQNNKDFVYYLGDVKVDGKNIRFKQFVDSLKIEDAETMNEIMSTESFPLNSKSELVLSNLFYAFDNTNYKESKSNEVANSIELVNTNGKKVKAEFNASNYEQSKLTDDKTSFKVDCSNIEDGIYYLRVKSKPSGNASYYVNDMESEEPATLNKTFNEIKIAENAVPTGFSLGDNYPNPFNPTTKISFSLPLKSQIKLKVFDVLGREIQILADGIYEAGKYEVEFNATNLPSGVYFYNLTTGSNSITKKMLLMK